MSIRPAERRSRFPLLAIWLSALSALSTSDFVAAADPPAVEPSESVSRWIEMSGASKGLAVLMGCDDPRIPLELARSGSFRIHVLDARAAAVERLRRAVDAKGLHGKRIIVERAPSDPLPHADNLVDLVIAPRLTEGDLTGELPSEIRRVLRPRGKAILGRPPAAGESSAGLTEAQLRRWLEKSGLQISTVSEDRSGLWAVAAKPVPPGIDEWTHWEHGPDNNPVSTDELIRAPYMTQWMGGPYYIAMPAITTAAGGKVFIAMGHIAHHRREEPWLNTLIARNGHNGTELWSRKLPDGYLAHRSAFVATADTLHMIDPSGAGCLLIDPETGEQRSRIDIPGVAGQWKWMAIEDGLLFALVGRESDPPETTIVRSKFTHWSWGELSKGYYDRRVPWGFGSTIVAYDLSGRKIAWRHREELPVDSRAMVVGGGRLFFYGPDSRLGCLDAKTGEVVWTNDDPQLRKLIEEPGRGLTSTPGFRTTCFALYTPRALFYEAQTRMNIVAVSLEDGRKLWNRRKTSNNPNMLYLDGRLIVGIGSQGRTLFVDPMNGETLGDLGFTKRSCARLTATPDSLFCRGWPEGLTRYDRRSRQASFNGAFRPACNDGVIGANGLLYLGPWACDCNLSLMGRVALCSAGDFDFKPRGAPADRVETGAGDISRMAPLKESPDDWFTARGDNARSGSTDVSVHGDSTRLWEALGEEPFRPTAPTAAGGLVFVCGDDGKVRAIDAASGQVKWTYLTAGPILRPPTIWKSRAYVGSGDGYVYALEAATGRLLWRFRAAPVERRIMVYGSLCSTWPVNSGVLVQDGVAYAAAGIIDYDGTYVYALDPANGELKWQNASSGHLRPDLRKGVSVQGGLTIAGGRLWMAGGNVISPAPYDLETGEYVGHPPHDGSPRANRGEEIGVLGSENIILGGRLQYSAYKNVVNPGVFQGFAIRLPKGLGPPKALHSGKIPPVWNSDRFVAADGRNGSIVCYRIEDLEKYIEAPGRSRRPASLWSTPPVEGGDAVALAMARNAVLAVFKAPVPRALRWRWKLCALDPEGGSILKQIDLPRAVSAGGLLVDRDGRIVLVTDEGRMLCYGRA